MPPGPFEEDTSTQSLRILSIDGGGIRGIVPATVLAALEEISGKRVHELFDVIAGTSTGAILALGLTHPDSSSGRPRTARELVDIYRIRGAEIFPDAVLLKTARRAFGHQYDHRPLRRVVEHAFGDAWLSDCVGDVVVPTYDVGKGAPRILRSRDASSDPDDDYPLTDVICAACSAPSYFPVGRMTSRRGSERVVIDGGVFANNPTMLALAEHPDRRPSLVVSLGTGNAKVHLSHDRFMGLDRGWYGVRTLIAMVMDGTSDSVDDQARAILGTRYYRFDTLLEKASEGLDDASVENVDALRRAAGDLVNSCRPRLRAVAELLSR